MDSAVGRTVAELKREKDWTRSPLGPPERWSALLRSTFDTILGSPVQICCFWGEEYCAFYNDAYAPTIGTKHPGALGSPARAYWTELWDDLRPLLDRVRLRGETVHMRDRPFQISRHGYLENVNFDIAYSPVREADGSIAGVICIVNETTERVAAEAQLRENEGRLRFLDRLGAELSRETEADALLATATRLLGQHLGVSRCAYADVEPDGDIFTIRGDWSAPHFSSLVGRYRLSDFGRTALEDLSAGRPLILRDTERDLPPDESTRFRAVNVRATVSMPLLRGERLIAVMAIHHFEPRQWSTNDILLLGEVTERCWAHIERARAEKVARQQAERARLAIDAAAIGIWDYDLVAGELKWDARCRELFGLPPDAPVTYEGSFLAGVHPEDRPRMDDFVKAASQSDATYVTEYRVIDASDGHERWLAVRGRSVAEQGKVVRFIGTVIDISELKRTEAVLQTLNATLEQRVMEEVAERSRAEERLRQAQKMEAVGQLTGGIAHDFNNMLAVVISGLNLARRKLERGDADIGRFLDASLDGAHRAATLTKRLLDFSRQQPLAPEPTDVNRLIEGMRDMLDRTLGEPVQVETVACADLWPSRVDPAQLENALVNLAVNARDAMPGGGRLIVETDNTKIDETLAGELGIPIGDYVLIAVTDTGVGMDAETLAKAFDPFFTTKPVGKGTGLGLSQVYGFVRQSNGHVRIYSEPGLGTTVRIYLPRLPETASAAAEAERGRPATVRRGSTEELILVVEDDDRVRALSIELLRDLGYSVVAASGGPEALRLIAGGLKPALLFTDVVMPGMSGRQLVDEVKKIAPAQKVLYTTGYTRDAIVHNGVLDAGTHLISKPFTVEDLAAKVRGLLDG